MDKIYDWMRSLTEAKLEYSLFWSNAEQEAKRPALAKDCAAYASPAPTSVELTTGAEPGGAVLCLVTGNVFKQEPFGKPTKVARQRPKKGVSQRIGWRQGNSFAPLLALGGDLPEEQLAAAGRRHHVRAPVRPGTLLPYPHPNLS